MKFQQGNVVVIEIVCYIQIRKKQGGVPGILGWKNTPFLYDRRHIEHRIRLKNSVDFMVKM